MIEIKKFYEQLPERFSVFNELMEKRMVKQISFISSNIEQMRNAYLTMFIISGAVGALSVNLFTSPLLRMPMLLLIALVLIFIILGGGLPLYLYILTEEGECLTNELKYIIELNNGANAAMQKFANNPTENGYKTYQEEYEELKQSIVIKKTKEIPKWLLNFSFWGTIILFDIALLLICLSFMPLSME